MQSPDSKSAKAHPSDWIADHCCVLSLALCACVSDVCVCVCVCVPDVCVRSVRVTVWARASHRVSCYSLVAMSKKKNCCSRSNPCKLKKKRKKDLLFTISLNRLDLRGMKGSYFSVSAGGMTRQNRILRVLNISQRTPPPPTSVLVCICILTIFPARRPV